MQDDFDVLRGNAPTQDKCRSLRRVVRALTDSQRSELQRRAEWVARATAAGSEWDQARLAALAVLLPYRDGLTGDAQLPARMAADWLLTVAPPLTYASDLGRVADALDTVIRRDTPPDVAAALKAWRDATEQLGDNANVMHADGAWFAVWMIEQTTDEAALLDRPDLPAIPWGKIADALGNLSDSTPPDATAEGLTGDDATPPEGKALDKRLLLAYLAFKYAEARLGRRLRDREAWEYLHEYGIDEEKGDAGELVDWKLPRFGTFTRYVSAARTYFGEQKHKPRKAKAPPTGRSIVKAAEIENQHRDE